MLRSFCATLGYNPTILAHKNSPDNVTYELAQLVKAQSDKGSKKAVFVIIDRGMDIRAVLMHDLCLQVENLYLLLVPKSDIYHGYDSDSDWSKKRNYL